MVSGGLIRGTTRWIAGEGRTEVTGLGRMSLSGKMARGESSAETKDHFSDAGACETDTLQSDDFEVSFDESGF